MHNCILTLLNLLAKDPPLVNLLKGYKNVACSYDYNSGLFNPVLKISSSVLQLELQLSW